MSGPPVGDGPREDLQLHPAVRALHAIKKTFPHIWETYAEMLANPIMPWPSWCWCPMAGAHVVVQRADIEREPKIIGVVAALAAWRATQGIYRFDVDIIEELLGTELRGDLPTDVLKRLPEWCCYVELDNYIMPGSGSDPLLGFWAHLEYDVARGGAEELRLLLNLRGALFPVAIVLGSTVEAGLRKWAAEVVSEAPGFVELVQRLVSVVLYLCADNAEVEGLEPLPPRVVKGKKRPILPSRPPVVHLTGMRLGAALRHARRRYAPSEDATPTGRTVHPHVRKSHYHHYWTGPRDGERKLICHWLPPIPVMLDGPPEEPTLHPVH